MSVGGFALAERFILLFYGVEYQPSIPAFEILIWLLAGSFGSYIFTTTLNSSNREKTVTLIILCCCLLNIALNFALIPKWSHIGASVATIVTELCLFILSFIAVKKLVFKAEIIRFTLRPGLASAAMYGILILTESWMIFFQIIIGMIVYLIVLLNPDINLNVQKENVISPNMKQK